MFRVHKRFIIIGVLLILISSTIGSHLILLTGDSIKAGGGRDNRNARVVVGPKEMLDNTDFSAVRSWVLIDATKVKPAPAPAVVHTDVRYNNLISPQYIVFENDQQLNSDETPISPPLKARLTQTFNKTFWTSNNPNSVICSFDYTPTYYNGLIDGSPAIYADIILEIMNLSTGVYGRWPIEKDATPNFGNGSYKTDDSRITYPSTQFFVTRDIGSGPTGGSFPAGVFNISPPGLYELSIIFQIWSTTQALFNVNTYYTFLFDNVSLQVMDVEEPAVVANNSSFGPFNNNTYDDQINGKIDIDFFAGSGNNTPLNEGKYRLNNSGKPGQWHLIFKSITEMQYTYNWSIAAVWANMSEGKNYIDIYCSDQAGNYNDSVQITVIKDTIPPVTYLHSINEYQTTKEFHIYYYARDPVPSGGFNSTVILMFKHNGSGKYVNYTTSDNPSGLFDHNPILFDITKAGVGYGEGKYEFYSIGIDNTSNQEAPPAQNKMPDTDTIVDIHGPKLIFIEPKGKYIVGTETLTIESENDTKLVEFYYWLDLDKDGQADDVDDISSVWVLIDTIYKPKPGQSDNWSTEWDTKSGKDFILEEGMVVLKAMAVDIANNVNEAYKNNIEVDNVAPKVKITNPETLSPENEALIWINYTTDPDVMYATFYYRIHDDKEDNAEWIKITDKENHTYGDTIGTYQWVLSKEFRQAKPRIDIKVEVSDDAGNTGMCVVEYLQPPPVGPKIKSDFPTQIMWEEDFGKKTLKLTKYESHYDSSITGDNLKWYITWNSEKLFHITGNNNTGENADTFVFTSIENRYGQEVLTYHLHDMQGIEATIEQTIIVISKPDRPEFNPPTETIHVRYGEPDTFDLSYYIFDVDNNKIDLILTTNDPKNITTNGLNLTFNYGGSMKGQKKLIRVTVTDFEYSITRTIEIFISDNHRPKLVLDLPNDIVLQSGVVVKDILDLDEYFHDLEDDDKLTFTSEESIEYDGQQKVIISIGKENNVTLEALPNVEGQVTIRFTAKDPLGAWGVGDIKITIKDIPDPPRIKTIPDINVHYYNPNSTTDYDGYGYDFSYFVNDPDTDRSELIVWAQSTMDENDDAWIQEDPKNNMRLIFKFPFTAVGKHTLVLYAQDPNPKTEMAYRHFNVTVIIDAWPVEYIGTIPEQSFFRDAVFDNAFNFEDYFEDKNGQAGGTDYSILENPKSNVNAVIDRDNYVDLSCKSQYWHGYDEFVILAMDTNPVQYVYAVIKVHVLYMPPPPLDPLPIVNLKIGEEKTLDLSNYFFNANTHISDLVIETNDPEHIWVDGTKLIIKYDKEGTYFVKVWVIYPDGTNRSSDLIIYVDEPSKPEQDKTSTTFMYELIVGILVTVVFVVLLILFFMVKKRPTPLTHKQRDRIVSSMPVKTVKRGNTQEKAHKILIYPQPTQTPTDPSQPPVKIK